VRATQRYQAEGQFVTSKYEATTDWEEKISKFKQQANEKLAQLKDKHEQDLTQAEVRLQDEVSSEFKPSAKLLNMMHIEKNLALRKDYLEAHAVQQSVRAQVTARQHQAELDAFHVARQAKIDRQLKLLSDRQTLELDALKKKLRVGLAELKAKQERDLSQ
jgi:hypothetical protein